MNNIVMPFTWSSWQTYTSMHLSSEHSTIKTYNQLRVWSQNTKVKNNTIHSLGKSLRTCRSK